MEVTVHKAKTQLSALLKRVETGEDVIIRRGTYGPGFRLVQVKEDHPRRTMEPKQEWKGKILYTDKDIWESEWEED